MGAGTEMSRLDSIPTATLNKLLELAESLPVEIANPTDGQTLVYDATAGEWKNGSGGGGGTVLADHIIHAVATEVYDETTDTTSYSVTADMTPDELFEAGGSALMVLTFEDSSNTYLLSQSVNSIFRYVEFRRLDTPYSLYAIEVAQSSGNEWSMYNGAFIVEATPDN